MPNWMEVAPLAVTLFVVLMAAVMLGRRQLQAQKDNKRELSLLLETLERRMDMAEHSSNALLTLLREELRASQREAREETARNVTAIGQTQSLHQKDIAAMQRQGLELFARQISEMSRNNEARQEALRQNVDERLRELQASNEEKLEKMRVVVYEKLNTALENRLGAAFTNVSEQLDKVHRGLGEMKSLASDVGDLRKVLTNVKTRGTWGEIQLGALLEQILTKEQYGRDVAVIPGMPERVEFAIRLPGGANESGAGGPVWLPIDSKFPQEDYLRLVDASAACDAEGVAAARKALESRVMAEGKKIRDKYIAVPHTTDFAILYLPVEGLYSEVLRIDGLCERLMRDYRVVVSGPTTVAALLNSLQMGFRTLAVEKRSSEVWVLLGQVKTEFGKFGAVLEKVRSRIELAGKDLEGAERRTRAIERRLRGVESGGDGLDEGGEL